MRGGGACQAGAGQGRRLRLSDMAGQARPGCNEAAEAAEAAGRILRAPHRTLKSMRQTKRLSGMRKALRMVDRRDSGTYLQGGGAE
jgi:hypothetical protein